jgi:hypothetical protein
MDRVYRADIPAHVKALEKLKGDFSVLESGTDWTRLRVEPLLEHARSLHRVLRAAEFSRERSRLRTGVEMFHADLVYLRTNIAALKKVLESTRGPAARKRPRRSGARRRT